MSAPSEDVVFREPFDLRLEIDGTHFYQEHFDRIPYVFDNTVYLFKGDSFGVGVPLDATSGGVCLEPLDEKADVFFKFEQRADGKGGQMMVLTIANRTDRTLTVRALMTVPGEKAVFNTTTLPVRPKMTNYESWPHPIVQLVLRSFRLR